MLHCSDLKLYEGVCDCCVLGIDIQPHAKPSTWKPLRISYSQNSSPPTHFIPFDFLLLVNEKQIKGLC